MAMRYIFSMTTGMKSANYLELICYQEEQEVILIE